MRKNLVIKILFLFACGFGISAKAQVTSQMCDSMDAGDADHCICDTYKIQSEPEKQNVQSSLLKEACKHVLKQPVAPASFSIGIQRFLLSSVAPIQEAEQTPSDTKGSQNNSSSATKTTDSNSSNEEQAGPCFGGSFKTVDGKIAVCSAKEGAALAGDSAALGAAGFDQKKVVDPAIQVEKRKAIEQEAIDLYKAGKSSSDVIAELDDEIDKLGLTPREKENYKKQLKDSTTLLAKGSTTQYDEQYSKTNKNIEKELEADRNDAAKEFNDVLKNEKVGDQEKINALQDGENMLMQQNVPGGQFNPNYLSDDPSYRSQIMAFAAGGENCGNMIDQYKLSNFGGDEGKKVIQDALNSEFDFTYAKNSRYAVSTCERYTTNNFFQENSNNGQMGARQFVQTNICADAAKTEHTGASCRPLAKMLLTCSASRISNHALTCPKLAIESGQATLDDVKGLFSRNVGAVFDKSLATYLSDVRAPAQNQKTQINDQSCFRECESLYAETLDGGFKGCLEKVNADLVNKTIGHCISYKEVAKMHFNNGEFESRDGQDNHYQSFDGRYECSRSTPFASDYRACKTLLNTYNAGVVAEQGLAMSEGVQRSIREANSYERLAQAQAGGDDIQTLGINVVKDSAKTNEVLATQRAGFYTAQVGVLGTMLALYPSKSNLGDRCFENGLDGQLCSNAVYYAEESGSADRMLFPNKPTQKQFLAELIQAAGKSAVAWIQKGQYRKQQNILTDVQKQMTPEESDSGFDIDPSYCQRYPNSNECRGSGNRRNVDGFNGGGINVGSVGNNDYSFGNDGVGEYNESRDLPSASTISDISSMLGEGGEKGSNDFNRVAAPELSRGGGAGGGGGGPSGGGGAAGLSGGSGGAAQGAGAEGDGSVGITKSSGRYAGTGGTAYTAGTARRLGQDQKVDNPFSSLFGAKNSARDVASQVENDIAPAKIGLFETISSRYQKVNNDKRLLDSNVK